MSLQGATDIRELGKILGCDVQSSAFIHLTPLPQEFDLSTISHNPYILTEENKLAIIHNGYAFGGQRFEESVEPYGPDDCSTFVARHCGFEYMTTTAEQYLAHQFGRETFHFTPLGEDVIKIWEEETKPKFQR